MQQNNLKNQMITMSNDNNTIEAVESDYLYKSESQLPNAGNGLFTTIDIYVNETVAIFKGEVLSDIEAEKRVKEGSDKYFINLLDNKILDSMHTLCLAKYANDAEGSAKSNFKNNTKISLDDNNAVCIEATRKIKAYEEVFCSYGKNYWKKHG